MDYEKLYTRASAYVSFEQDEHFRAEVVQAINDEDLEQLTDRFYTDLQFGTAGMRGVIGGGFNRMNPYMVQLVTQGFAGYILDQFSDSPSVVIACDNRRFSREFAESAAVVLCANGIKVYLYDEIRPVPLLSYAVRHLGASAGITITASHNPAEYNGYKVYWSDGAQVIAPHDEGIAESVKKITDGSMIKSISLEQAKEQKLLFSVPEEVDEAYYRAVSERVRHPELFSQGLEHTVVYTPLHGSGNIPVRRLFDMHKVNYHVVPEQELPDGDFPTVLMPNPEDKKAMNLAVSMGRRVSADLILGTDPDSDRLGIGVPVDEKKTEFQLLTGNQIAVLLCDYLVEVHKTSDRQLVCVKSIVTTDLMARLVEARGFECRDVLTGFKYIADEMHKIERENREFLFGAEESFGYNSLDFVYDKDAVSTALLAVEMMLYYKKQNKTLLKRLEELWMVYGYYNELVISRAYPGAEGRSRIESIMEEFRERPPREIAGLQVTQYLDLLDGSGELPPADVVILKLEGGSKVVVRPSGTEPKIKYYLFTVSQSENLGSAVYASEQLQKTLIEALGLEE